MTECRWSGSNLERQAVETQWSASALRPLRSTWLVVTVHKDRAGHHFVCDRHTEQLRQLHENRKQH
jgi:hypothetical protein